MSDIKKNALQYADSRKQTVTCSDRRMDKACGAKVFQELRARWGPGWLGKMASAPAATPTAAENRGVRDCGCKIGGAATGAPPSLIW